MDKSAYYTTVWNLLGHAALTIPVFKVGQTQDVKEPVNQFFNDIDRQNFELYNPSTFANARVQVVRRTLGEDLEVFAMSEIVDLAVTAAKALKASESNYKR